MGAGAIALTLLVGGIVVRPWATSFGFGEEDLQEVTRDLGARL